MSRFAAILQPMAIAFNSRLCLRTLLLSAVRAGPSGIRHPESQLVLRSAGGAKAVWPIACHGLVHAMPLVRLLIAWLLQLVLASTMSWYINPCWPLTSVQNSVVPPHACQPWKRRQKLHAFASALLYAGVSCLVLYHNLLSGVPERWSATMLVWLLAYANKAKNYPV